MISFPLQELFFWEFYPLATILSYKDLRIYRKEMREIVILSEKRSLSFLDKPRQERDLYVCDFFHSEGSLSIF